MVPPARKRDARCADRLATSTEISIQRPSPTNSGPNQTTGTLGHHWVLDLDGILAIEIPTFLSE